jgi:hypothetical protein
MREHAVLLGPWGIRTLARGGLDALTMASAVPTFARD